MKQMKSLAAKKYRKARHNRDYWDEDGRAIRRKDHRRSRRVSKRALFEFDHWAVD